VGELTTAAGIVAVAATALALVALGCCILLARRLRAMGAAQRVILGDSGERDLIAHGSDLERRLADLGGRVEELVGELSESDAELAAGLDGAVSHCAVVRYDAMGEMTGRQSSSVALLDSHRSGVVLSSILHREQARLYAKQIVDGGSEFELSPEEVEAIGEALRPRGGGDGG
jgi:hypothetical protein